MDPALAEEVSAAYEHYWQVRAEAFFDLDASRLSEVMAGEHLLAGEKLIKQLRSEGHAIRTEVKHQYAVVKATQYTAEIIDTYSDESVYVDLASRNDQTEPVGNKLDEQYDLQKIDGIWKVVGLGRYD